MAHAAMKLLHRPEEIKQRFFAHHSKPVARLNHGSFGSCPTPVQAEQLVWQQQWNAQPDEFCHEILEEALLSARNEVASAIGCSDVNNLVLIDNATTAAVMVAQQVSRGFHRGEYPRGSVILMLDCAYGAVKKVFRHYLIDSSAGARIVDVKIPFPVNSVAEVLQAIETSLTELQTECEHLDHVTGQANGLINIGEMSQPEQTRPLIPLAIVDHISSMPTFVLPLSDIIPLLRRHGVQRVFVDGAHAVGNIDIDVDSLQVDYYTSNLHKWAFAPTAAAFLYMASHTADMKDLAPVTANHLPLHGSEGDVAVSQSGVRGATGREGEVSAGETREDASGCCSPVASIDLVPLHHPIISHNYRSGIARECAWIGTRDYSPLLAAPHGLKFPERHLGCSLSELAAYNRQMAARMARMLADAWGTRLGAPEEMCSAMAMVELPPGVHVHDEEGALKLRGQLRNEFAVEAPVHYCLVRKGEQDRHGAFVRVSHQVYNMEDEYRRLRDAVLQISNAQILRFIAT